MLETLWFTASGLPIVWHVNLFSFIHSFIHFSKSLKLPQDNVITSLQTKNGDAGSRNAACTAK